MGSQKLHKWEWHQALTHHKPGCRRKMLHPYMYDNVQLRGQLAVERGVLHALAFLLEPIRCVARVHGARGADP